MFDRLEIFITLGAVINLHFSLQSNEKTLIAHLSCGNSGYLGNGAVSDSYGRNEKRNRFNKDVNSIIGGGFASDCLRIWFKMLLRSLG